MNNENDELLELIGLYVETFYHYFLVIQTIR